jgi:hypothetical protein
MLARRAGPHKRLPDTVMLSMPHTSRAFGNEPENTFVTAAPSV